MPKPPPYGGYHRLTHPSAERQKWRLFRFSRKQKHTRRFFRAGRAQARFGRIPPEPFPNTMICRLKYSDYQRITALATNLATEKTYRTTDLYDPDFSGTGRTVASMDLVSAVYEKYKIIGCRYKVTFFNPEVDAMWCGVSQYQRTSTSGKGLRQVGEYPTTQVRVINNSGSQNAVIKGYLTPWSQLAMSKLQYMADVDFDHVFTTTTADSLNQFIRVFAGGLESTTPTIDYIVEMTYIVKCWKRKFTESSAF